MNQPLATKEHYLDVEKCRGCADFEQSVFIAFDDGIKLTIQLSPDRSNYTALIQNVQREGVTGDARHISYKRSEQGWQQLVADCELSDERLGYRCRIDASVPKPTKPEECKPYLDAHRRIEISYSGELMELMKEGQFYYAQVWLNQLKRYSLPPDFVYTSDVWEQVVIEPNLQLRQWLECGTACVPQFF